MKEEKIKTINEFIEKPKKKIVGFTVIYESGRVQNFYIRENDFEHPEEIRAIKLRYKKLIKNI